MTCQIHVERLGFVYRDSLRAYRIVLDGETVAKIRSGERLTLEGAPGPHSICFRADHVRSRSLQVNPADGDHVFVRCSARPGGLIAYLFQITIGFREYIFAEVVDARRAAYLESD